jgi:YggT family protein
MGFVLAIVSLALLLVQVLLIARAVLDWSAVLAGPSTSG